MSSFKRDSQVFYASKRSKKPSRGVVVEVDSRRRKSVSIRFANGDVVDVDPFDVWESNEQAWIACRDNAGKELAKAKKRLEACEAALASIALDKKKY